MNKILILTANTGNRDLLIDPPQKFPGCDYIAIVDRSYAVKDWEQYQCLEFSNIDTYKNRRNAKVYKVLSTILFPQYEYIFWHDANHQLKVDPYKILEEYGNLDLLLFKHPDRDCIYKEMKAVEGWLDLLPNTQTQEEYYRKEGMPEEYGLYEMTCFVKRNVPAVMKLELMWWEQICKYSSRDQCSFMYCLWKMQNELTIKQFTGFANLYAGGSPYFNEQYHIN